MPESFAMFGTAWFWQATALVAVAAVLCALVGSFLMLRRMSLLADAVSHAVLPGVVVGYMLAGYAAGAFLVGAVASGLLCVSMVGFLVRRTRLKEDAAMGVSFTALFALGIVLLSGLRSVDLDPGCVIYGEALAARPGSLVWRWACWGWRSWGSCSATSSSRSPASIPSRPGSSACPSA